MANGKIHFSASKGYAVTGEYRRGWGQIQTQYLHADGQWHWSPQHDTDSTLWPGYWGTEAMARQAMEAAPEPNLPVHGPQTPVCDKCCTLAPEGLDAHKCYSVGLKLKAILLTTHSEFGRWEIDPNC